MTSRATNVDLSDWFAQARRDDLTALMVQGMSWPQQLRLMTTNPLTYALHYPDMPAEQIAAYVLAAINRQREVGNAATA